MLRSNMDGRIFPSIISSRGSTLSSNGNGPAQATSPCPTLPPSQSGSIRTGSSTRPRSPHPCSLRTYTGRAAGRVAATARTRSLAIRSLLLSTPALATTTAPKSERRRHHPPPGRIASTSLNPRLYTLVGMPALVGRMLPASPSFPRHQPSPILTPRSYPKTMTKTSPFPPFN